MSKDNPDAQNLTNFTPAPVQQGEGIFQSPIEMRMQAEAQQRASESDDPMSGWIDHVNADDAIGANELYAESQANAGQDDKVADNASTEFSAGVGENGEYRQEGSFTHNGVEFGGLETAPHIHEAFKGSEMGVAGLDKVNAELFSEGGLTEATRAELDKAFGAGIVDANLALWESQNKVASLEQGNADSVSDNEYNSAIDKIVADTIGADKLDSVMSWANQNLSAEDYAEYAGMINGDNPRIVGMALKELAEKSGVRVGAPKPSVRSLGINSETAQGVSTSDGLSQAEYLKLFEPGEGGVSPYWGNEAKYDGLRDLGRQQGL